MLINGKQMPRNILIDEQVFPWRIYTIEELKLEYERLKRKVKEKIKFPIQFSSIGFKCTNCMFQYERMNTPGIGRPSTIDYWKKSKETVIKFSNKENRDYFSTLNYFNHSPSQFPIVIASKIYRHFSAKKIFDPFAGWGDRCLAAMALDINYTGIDCNKKLVEPYKELLKIYGSYTRDLNSEMVHSSCGKIKIIFDRCENVDSNILEQIKFDLVLTSPPFWKKGQMLERYNDIEIPYSTFMTTCLIPILRKCFEYGEKGSYICLYIPNSMYKDLVKVFGECNEILLFKTNRKTVSDLYCWKINIC